MGLHVDFFLNCIILEALACDIITDIFIDKVGDNDTYFDSNKLIAELLKGREFYMISIAKHHDFAKVKHKFGVILCI